MPNRNIVAALVLIAFTSGYAYLTAGLVERTLPNTLGPSFFPWALAACLMFFSVMLLLQGVWGKFAGPASVSKPSAGRGRSTLGLLLLLAYLGALPYLGFLVATPPLFGGLMWAAGQRRPYFIIGFSLAIPVAFYILFRHIFQIVLPARSLFG